MLSVVFMCLIVEMLSGCSCQGNAVERFPAEANAASHTLSTAH